MLVTVVTHAAFSELFCIYGGREIEPPGVVGDGVLPVDEALGGLADPRS